MYPKHGLIDVSLIIAKFEYFTDRLVVIKQKITLALRKSKFTYRVTSFPYEQLTYLQKVKINNDIW